MAMAEAADYSTESGKPKLGVRIASLAFPALCRLTSRSGGTLNRRLSDLLEFKAPASPLTPCPLGVCSKDVTVSPTLWLRIFTPAQHEAPGKLPIVFYFHGGGFAYFSADFRAYDAFCRRLCSGCRAVVVSVSYRRAPEHKFPAAYDDCFAALEWLQAQGREHVPGAADAGACVLAGDSAGGNIAHHVACRVAAEGLGSAGGEGWAVRVVGLVLLFPFFGGEERTASEVRLRDGYVLDLGSSDWFWEAFLPPDAGRDHPACNVLGPRAPPFPPPAFPPSLVVVAEFDLLKDRQIHYFQRLHASRDPPPPARLLYFKGGVHAFHLIPDSLFTHNLLRDVQSFISDVVQA